MTSPVSSPFVQLPGWKRDWLLFWNYVKITSLVVGGGYAIIAAAQQEFVERLRWLDEEDVLEMVTITQTVPGILAVNSAVYIGWRVHGWRGAVAALVGAVLPSLVIVTLIAAGAVFLKEYLETPVARGAFRGVIACITGMVIVTALKLRRKTLKNAADAVIALFCLAGMCVFRVNPAWLILAAVAFGLVRCLVRKRGERP